MQTSAPKFTTLVTVAATDVLCVLIFVMLGRRSHAEASSLLGFLNTAWPFLTGLGLGWGLVYRWRAPQDIFPAGIIIWISTVTCAMILRVLVGQGTALSFIVVASVFTGLFLLGWRALSKLSRGKTRG
ncbi:MAG: DUF3054 domain-containing protein [Mycobacteriaceae bacterium]